jgi:CRP-like cAMP-binding protein
LINGSLEVLINGNVNSNYLNILMYFARKIKKSEGFGDLALLSNAARTTTVRALEDSKLW